MVQWLLWATASKASWSSPRLKSIPKPPCHQNAVLAAAVHAVLAGQEALRLALEVEIPPDLEVRLPAVPEDLVVGSVLRPSL